MAAPDPHAACVELDVDFTLPSIVISLFGIDLSADLDGKIPFPSELSASLLGKVNGALMPLMPVFDIIDIMLTLADVLDAIATLNPIKIADVVAKFKAQLAKLLKIVPQLSIPIFIKGVLSAILVFLLGFRADLQAIIDAQTRLDAGHDKAVALGSADLEAALGCAQVNLDAMFTAKVSTAAPINRLIKVINLLIKIAKIPVDPLPDLANLGEEASEALQPIDELIKLVRLLRDAIPIPT